MLKVLRFKLVLLAGLSVLCATGIAQESGSRWLVPPDMLKDSALEIVWQTKLPIKELESLERLFVLGDGIYALSSRNYLVCLNRENGSAIFSRPIADAGLPVVGLELYNNKLFSIAANKLIEINPESGAEQSSKNLNFVAACPASRNKTLFYAAGVDRRIRALRATDKMQVFEAAAENDSKITSVIADGNAVVFTTDAGNVICILPDRPKLLWQFNAAGGVVGPIVEDADELFFACKDTNIYKINMLTGKLLWKCQTEAILDKAPVVTKNVVYQYVRGKGLAAIDKKSGTTLWLLAGGVRLLAEAGENAYVITDTGTLTAMDNKKAKQIYSVEFIGVSRYATNLIDSKIYIADGLGRITCLKPIK